MTDALSGPATICPDCGWEGALPNFASQGVGFENLTFEGVKVECPNCGGLDAEMVSGTYSLFSGLLRQVRQTGITAAQLRRLREAAEAAREHGTPDVEDLLAEDPALVPIVNTIARRFPRRPFLLMLIVVLGIMSPYLEAVATEAPAPLRPQIERLVHGFDAQPDQLEREEAGLVAKGPQEPWQAPYLLEIGFMTNIEEASGDFRPGRFLAMEMADGLRIHGWILGIELQQDGSHRFRLAVTPREGERLVKRLVTGAKNGASDDLPNDSGLSTRDHI